MTATLELSERLEECANYLEGIQTRVMKKEDFRRWAADIRSLVLPKPLVGAPGELPTE